MAAVLNSSMNSTASSSSLGIPEGARRASEGMPRDAAPPDPEVVATARRRQYSGTEKRALLAEADRHKAAGTLGAFLRSKHIYSSMLSSWRKQLGAADRVALESRAMLLPSSTNSKASRCTARSAWCPRRVLTPKAEPRGVLLRKRGFSLNYRDRGIGLQIAKRRPRAQGL